MIRSLLSRKFVQDTLALQIGKITQIALSLISSVVVWRVMGPEAFGVFALAQSFLVVWQSLDLTGVGTSTGVRLAIAIGAGDAGEILDLMAFYVKVSVAVNVGLALLIRLLGTQVASAMQNEERIAGLAFWLAVAFIADGLYNLVIIALQSRRSMRTLALMQNLNQLVLTVSLIAAVLISPTPESLVLGRLVYSYATLALALLAYTRVRTQGQLPYPTLRAIAARARTVSVRPYWRFGVANAIDKNLASLFVQLPVQIVGIFAGTLAVGYLNLALTGIAQSSVLTSAVFDNMQAVVPQAVGRGDYAALWRNFMRVLLVLALGAVVVYGALVLLAPLVIPPVLGAEWIPAIPVLTTLAIYGAITTVGGIFGPLYRAFSMMRPMIIMRVVVLVLVLTVGALALAGSADAQTEAVAGAWMINGLFVLSVVATAALTLPGLRKKALA
jgi:O-antigen/teichoic acid export membrane protein